MTVPLIIPELIPGGSPFDVDGGTWEAFADDGEDRPRLQTLSINLGRDNELDQFPPATATAVLRSNDRVLDPEYDDGPYAGQLLPRVPVRARAWSPALVTLGYPSAGTASTPDHVSYALNNMDIRMHVAATDWTPAPFGQIPASQWGNSGNQGWTIGIGATGTLIFNFTTNGSTLKTRTSTASVSFTNGTFGWIRVTFVGDNGAGGHTVTFYTSEDAVTWTQLGSAVVTAGTTTVFNSTADLVVGDTATPGIFAFAGTIRSFQLRNGANGFIVADLDFAETQEGVSLVQDRLGHIWTVNGTADIQLAGPDELFTMFVKDGWEQQYLKPYGATCTLELTDLLDVITGTALPQSAYDAVVLADGPKAFWKMDEESGTQMFDSSGNGLHGQRDNGEAVDPLVVGGGKAFNAPHIGDNRGIFIGESLPVGYPCTIEAWIKTPRDLTQSKTIVGIQKNGSLTSAVTLMIDGPGASPNGQLAIEFLNLGGGYTARGQTPIDDDRVHYVAVTIGGTAAADVLLYVDGVVETKTTVSGTTPGNWPGHFWWTVANAPDTGFGDFGLDGAIDEVAVYDRVLSAAEIAEHYDVGLSAHDGDLSGARIDRVLDLVGVPASMRNIADGDTAMGPADYGGSTVGEYLAKIIESEQGSLFCDHRNGGRITFEGRYHRITDTRSNTSQASFTDVAGEEWCYRPELRVEPNGMASLINTVDVQWQGGTETVDDPASVDAYGANRRSIATDAPNPATAQSAGRWLMAQHSQPQTRVRSLPLTPGGSQTGLRAVVLGQQISDRITVNRNPVNVGDQITNELYVEGIHHEFDADGTWLTTYNTSNADTAPQPFIWSVSRWGVDTRWG